MTRRRAGFEIVPVARAQRQIGDWLETAARRHAMHALLEVDVTDARRKIRATRARTHEPLSFTAYIVACLARAIDENKSMHAHRKGRGKLVLFDDVDVAVAVEHVVEGARIPMPHIIRAANRKSPARITREVGGAVVDADPYGSLRRLLPVWLFVPGPLRRFVLGMVLGDPIRRKRATGTTFVSAVGMFGSGTAWGVPMGQNYTLGLTVGSIARRPGIVHDADGERVETREYLALTLTFDHDVVEGAQAARFTNRFQTLLADASILDAAHVATTAAEPAGTASA